MIKLANKSINCIYLDARNLIIPIKSDYFLQSYRIDKIASSES